MSGVTEASSIAPAVDHLTWALMAASTFLILVVFGLIGVFLIRYREGSAAPRGPWPVTEWKVETAWIAGTTLGFLAFFFCGARVFLRIESPPAGAEEIHVTGRQWMWDIRQPNGRREFDTLHVPLGSPIVLRLTSEDVIHSFYVPSFRLKQDVVPGKEVALWFTATRPGTYPIFCSEFCGSKHAEMGGEVIVQQPEDYAAWLAGHPAPGGPLAAGRALFVKYGCSGCHEAGSIVHAPRLEGLYGTRAPQADGSFAQVDEAYLRDCILQPEKTRVAGYLPVMPSFRGVIPEAELTEIIAYLRGGAAP